MGRHQWSFNSNGLKEMVPSMNIRHVRNSKHDFSNWMFWTMSRSTWSAIQCDFVGGNHWRIISFLRLRLAPGIESSTCSALFEFIVFASPCYPYSVRWYGAMVLWGPWGENVLSAYDCPRFLSGPFRLACLDHPSHDPPLPTSVAPFPIVSM